MIGRVFAQRYRLAEFIGKGGMALVYRAVDLRTGHDVAVKILRPELNQDQEFLARFQREAMAASKMNHHNIVNLLDVGVDNDCRYLVMEYVRGKTLKDVIHEKGALPPAIAGQICIRILSALQHAHDNGIIHRDIKPQNVLVHSEGHIKVADFGIARMVGSGTLSTSDSVMGSVHYFSPEQARGEQVSQVSDLYSVGVVLYEMLTGTVPFDGETPFAVASQHIKAQPRPMNDIKPGIPPAMQHVVSRALEKSPLRRYQTATEMAQELQRAIQQPEGDWATRTQDTPIPLISQLSDKNKAAEHAKKRKRNKLYWRVVAVLSSALVLLGLYGGLMRIYDNIVNTTSAPYLTGETETGAQRLAANAGVKLVISRVSDESVSMGTVIYQTPAFETKMKRGETLYVTISTGAKQKPCPKVTGMLYNSAKTYFERLGLQPPFIIGRELSSEPYGTILNQSIQEGVTVTAADIIKVTLSGGSVSVPGIIGMTRDEAIRTIEKCGLTCEVQIYQISDYSDADLDKNDRVANQSPVAGTVVMQNHKVDLAVYHFVPKDGQEGSAE